VVVTTYVQNRGTEPLKHVQMTVAVDGSEQTFDFFDLAVGKPAGHDLRIEADRLRRPTGVTVVCTATIDGAEDINPADNTNRTTFSLRPEQKPKPDAAAGAAP
jgi:hypothetical protein